MATQEELQLKPGEQISDYNARIAALRGDTPEQLAATQKTISPEKVAAIRATLPPISIPSTITSKTIASAPNLPIPAPQAPKVQESFIMGIAAQTDKARASLETTYKSQLDELQKKQAEAQNRIADFMTQEKTAIGEVEKLTAPFHETLEKTERERLHITENFEANQKLTNELDSLLSEGNALIKQQRGQPIASDLLSRIVNKTIEDVSARAGVIQAVFSSRNGQIAQAERMIDRGVAAITADRQDRLNYYSTLLKFYDGLRGEEKTDLTTLKTEERKVIEKQIELIEGDLKLAQSYAENIKKAMIDPDKAQTFAQAGVTLTDSSEKIATKLAAYAYQREVAKISNDMAEKGYSYLVPGQTAPAGTEVVTTTDSKGITKQYYKSISSSLTQEQRAIAIAQSNLIASRGSDGFVNPTVYQRERSNSTIGPTEFDKRFSHLLSPQEQRNLNITSTTNVGPSPEQQRTIQSWMAIHPAEAKQIDQLKLQTDQIYFYWVLNKIQ